MPDSAGDGYAGCVCELGYGGGGAQTCAIDLRPGAPAIDINASTDRDVATLAYDHLV